MTGWEERGCTRSEGAEQHCFSSSQFPILPNPTVMFLLGIKLQCLRLFVSFTRVCN